MAQIVRWFLLLLEMVLIRAPSKQKSASSAMLFPRGEFASKALSHSFTVFAKDMVEVILRGWLPATSYT